jgi:hypothetical protein
LTEHLTDLHRCGKEHFDIETPSRNGTQFPNSLNEYRNLQFSGYRIERVVSPSDITITNRCCQQIMLGNNKNKRYHAFIISAFRKIKTSLSLTVILKVTISS